MARRIWCMWIPILLTACVQSKPSVRGPERSPSPYAPMQPAPPAGANNLPPVATNPETIYAGPGEVAYIESGHKSFVTRVQLVRQARQSIRLQTFVWKGDDSGLVFANAVIDARKRGVAVSVILDDISNAFKQSQYIYYHLLQNGVTIDGFQPAKVQFLDRLDVLLNPATVNGGFVNGLFKFLKEKDMRYHDKFMIIDGENPATAVAMVGGTNIGNEYYDITGGDPLKNWRDQDILVRGPSVINSLMAAFNSNRQELATTENRKIFGTILQDPLIAPEIAKALNGNFISKLDLKKDRLQLVKQLSAQQLTPEWEPTPNISFVHHQPRRQRFLGEKTHIDLIAQARSEILIANSYFIPSDQMIAALINAAQRGVKVKILTNAKETTDSPPVVIVGRMYYDKLVSAHPANPIEIYEWGGEPVLRSGYGVAHQKYALFDGVTSIVGSYNLDPRSELRNSETLFVFNGPLTTQKIRGMFYNDIQPRLSTLVTSQIAKAYQKAANGGDFIKRELLIMFQTLL